MTRNAVTERYLAEFARRGVDPGELPATARRGLDLAATSYMGRCLSRPVFLDRQNLINVLQQQSEIALVVLAEAIILIGGKFDLSLESTVGLAPGLAVEALVKSNEMSLG